MRVYVKDARERITTLDVEPNDTIEIIKSMIEDEMGIHPDKQRLLFAGQQLEDIRTLNYYNIHHESTLQFMLKQSGMISTFTKPQAESLDPLVQYLMLSEEERHQADTPLNLLKEKAKQEKYNAFHTFQYVETGELLADEQFILLNSFLDFMWNKTAIEINTDRVDMRLSIEMDTFEYLVSIVDEVVPIKKVSKSLVKMFNKLFKEVPGARGEAKVALRMTEGPTNACIGFHCDGVIATSTTQIALNDPSEYKGGQLCYFVNDKVHFLTRPKGSVVQHPSRVLHGVTNLTEGTRKSLFILDESNGLGEGGVVHVTEDHVNEFKDEEIL